MADDSYHIRAITVYAGSGVNVPDHFKEAAFELGKV